MTYRSPLAILILIMPLLASAQKWPFEYWHEGKVVTENGDTTKGLVKYNQEQNFIQFSATFKQNSFVTLSARHVTFFEIFDTGVHKYRQFYTIPYALEGQYKVPVFFELLEEGKLTLLAREALELRTYTMPSAVGTYSHQVLVSRFFILQQNNLKPFSGSRDDLLTLMGPKASEEMKKFMHDQRIDLTDKYDFAKVVDHYNTLFGI